ncbi:MAG: SHOCT domain-containing protein [Desulfuromonadales bacterium]|jgi:putative membrane protein
MIPGRIFYLRAWLVAFILVAAGSGRGWAQGMMDGQGGMMGPGMWVFALLLWGFAIFGLICAVRWLVGRVRPGGEKPAPETPLNILKRRYAEGEIDREEFERMKKELK